MTLSTPKTYEEHLQYLYGIVRLKLWFVWWWQDQHADEPFSAILRSRVDIIRKTDIYAGASNPANANWEDSRWLDLEERLYSLYRSHSADSAVFEEAAFRFVQPRVEAQSKRDFEARLPLPGYQCGSLRYALPGEGYPGRVHIHIANAIAPKSIFAEPAYLADCLMDLMDKSKAEFGVEKLGSFTWLNWHPKWLALFPQEWAANMGSEDTDVQGHHAFWGQFITARGTFNARLGQQLRETRKFPFLPRYSWCSFGSLRQHLATFL